MKTNRNNLEIVAQEKLLPTVKEFFQMSITSSLTVFAWIFFRAESMTYSVSYISGVFSKSLFSFPTIRPYYFILLITLFILVEWLGRQEQCAFSKFILKWRAPFRYAFYYLFNNNFYILVCRKRATIYFQF
ncbi:MAG: hypothetical protein IT238_07905 [Bacteroidia bacterium]|nr:hypothetical protein [Bacteroidia bacterium]